MSLFRFVEESKFRQLTKDELWKVGSNGKILPQVPQERKTSGKEKFTFLEFGKDPFDIQQLGGVNGEVNIISVKWRGKYYRAVSCH